MRSLALSSLFVLLATVCYAEVPEAHRLSGHFQATSGSLDGEHVDLYLSSATVYQVRVGDRWFRVSRASADEAVLSGSEVDAPTDGVIDALNGQGNGATAGGSSLSLEVLDVTRYRATLDGESFDLERRILIPPADPEAYDRGPRGKVAKHLREAPAYPNEGAYEDVFWDDWGPVFYRGRLNGDARVIGIASDPGPTESLPFIRRSLVGDAGQRTQGFLEKLGLTESYVLVNAFTYPTRPSKVEQGHQVMDDFPEQLAWRNDFYDLLYDKGGVQGIVVLGAQAEVAFEAWNRSRMDRGLGDLRDEVTVVVGAHPSSGRTEWQSRELARGWRVAVEKLREVVTPDDAELAKQPNFGDVFSEVDYAEIPPGDLPKASQAYPWVRDNSWSRNKIKGRRNNSVRRYGRLNMEFNHLDDTTDFYRVTGRDPQNPNTTPSYVTYTSPAGEPMVGLRGLARHALTDRFGADSIYTRLVDGVPNKTRLMDVIDAADAHWKTDLEVKEELDHLYRDVPDFTPQIPTLGGND
ncbi:MAG: hypothetical protein R3F62_14455 [Planctomycetota bacterium]